MIEYKTETDLDMLCFRKRVTALVRSQRERNDANICSLLAGEPTATQPGTSLRIILKFFSGCCAIEELKEFSILKLNFHETVALYLF